jgi:hypothetical protein
MGFVQGLGFRFFLVTLISFFGLAQEFYYSHCLIQFVVSLNFVFHRITNQDKISSSLLSIYATKLLDFLLNGVTHLKAILGISSIFIY